MALNKVDLVYVETVKSKSTGNDTVFIIYSNIIYFSVLFFNDCSYLINQWQIILRGNSPPQFKILEEQIKSLR